MDVAAHQLGGGSIDHPVPFERRNPGEAGRGDDHVEMAAFARARVAFVLRAVVADLEQGRVQGGFECQAQALSARAGAHGADSLDSTPRNRYSKTPTMKIIAAGRAIQTLKKAHSCSL